MRGVGDTPSAMACPLMSLPLIHMALSLQRYTWNPTSPDSVINRFLKERSKKERERSMLLPIATENGDGYLPESLLIEIFSSLPVKVLLRCKTVCKSWHALISSPQFISKHMNNYYNNNDDWGCCLLAQCYVSQGELLLFELLLDETPRVLADVPLYDMPMKGSYVYGPCDGLYYIYNHGPHRILWNPALNVLKALPPIITKPNPPSNTGYSIYDEVYGFGLDPVTRDYKVVVIKGYWRTPKVDIRHPLSVLVYSLRTDSWRYRGDLARHYNLEKNSCYIFVNGCCYWLGSIPQEDEEENYGDNYGDVIFSFDMAADTFHEIQVPNYDQPACKCLGVYDDSPAFFSVHENEKMFDIWTLNEGEWIKKISIGPFPNVSKPVGHWKDNKVILDSWDRELVLCLPESQEIKYLGFYRDKSCEGVFAYMESLVSIQDKNKSDFDDVVECPFFFLDM